MNLLTNLTIVLQRKLRNSGFINYLARCFPIEWQPYLPFAHRQDRTLMCRNKNYKYI